jgi:hypothetical protein
MDLEVMEYCTEGTIWMEVPKPKDFTNLKNAKKRCDTLNRAKFGNISGINGYYYGVINKKTNVCIYPV